MTLAPGYGLARRQRSGAQNENAAADARPALLKIDIGSIGGASVREVEIEDAISEQHAEAFVDTPTDLNRGMPGEIRADAEAADIAARDERPVLAEER